MFKSINKTRFNKDLMNKLFLEINNGVKEIYKSERWTEHLKTISKFHNYSNRNIMLIKKQKPNATFVAGYQKWKNEFNRNVKKGEKGIKILLPIKIKTKDISDENIKDNKSKYKIVYKYVNVFDISQTEGEEVNFFKTVELKGNISNMEILLEILHEIANENNCNIYFSKNLSSCKGYYSLKSKKIVIKENMSQVQTIKTIIHELAHSFLHNSINIINKKSKYCVEIEAESVAYIVLYRLGIDTSDYSFDYIALWAQHLKNIELLEILDNIRDISYLLIKKIEDKYNNIYAKIYK